MTEDIDDLYTDNDPTRRVKGAQAPVLLVAGARGGSGTSLIALATAELAANAGRIKRVCLVDAVLNRADLRTWLRVNASPPSLVTATTYDDPTRALSSRDTLNQARPASVNDVSFAACLTSDLSSNGNNTVDPDTVLKVISRTRDVCDLVIVDVGTLDQRPGTITDTITSPLIRAGAWMLLTLTPDYLGARNAKEQLQWLTSTQDANRDRVMTIVNRREKWNSEAQVTGISQRLLQHSLPVGVIDADPTGLGLEPSKGTIPTRHKQLAPVLAKVLLRVTGRPAFEPIAATAEAMASELVADDPDEVTAPAPARPRARVPFRVKR